MDAAGPDFTLVIPAFDEEAQLPLTLASLAHDLDTWRIDYRVLVVDDGSRDDTRSIADRFGPRFATLSLDRHAGKGAAIRRGILASAGRVVGFTDADLPFDPRALRVAYDMVSAGDDDVVFGARDVAGSECHVRQRVIRRVAAYLFRTFAVHMLNLTVTDPQCGLKVFSRRAAQAIFTRALVDGYAFDSEVTLLVRALDFDLSTVPVTWMNNGSSTVSVCRDTASMIADVIRLRARYGRRELET